MGRIVDVNGRRWCALGLVVVLLAPAWSAFAQRARRAPARATSSAGSVVATVGTVRISRAELDARADQAVEQYKRSSGNRALPPEMTDLMRRQVVESMIRMQLLAYEADRTGLRGTPAEAEDEVRKAPVFNPGGRFDPVRYQAIKSGQRAAFDSTMAAVSRQIGARKLYSTLEARFMPSDADARAAGTRLLTRALVDHMTLKSAEFSGDYPEPREQQVAAWYAAHRGEYQRPDRATLTVAFVNSPGLPEAQRRVPGEMEAWTRRMRALTDSLAGALARGADYDAVTAGLGQRASVVVASDNFPGYWRGTPAQAAKLFDRRNRGHAIAEAIPAAEGFLLVRVDEVAPAHIAALREVAREIRTALRRDSRLHHEEHEQRALFAQARDSLAGPGWKLRYASLDTAMLALPAATEADLDHFYRAHQADYSSFDAQSGSIVVKPLAEVREDVRVRMQAERRLQLTRSTAEAILAAWSTGRRAPADEAIAAVRETPPLIPGSVIDTGLVAQALADTLWNMDTPRGTGMVRYRRGVVVWSVLDRVERVVPTFEQARPVLAARLAVRRSAEELAGAREYFARDSMRYALGNVLHFTRLAVNPPDLLTVPLTHAEVEKWRHDHLDRYSASELVTARHILIRPRDTSAAADAAARDTALALLHRAQAGEDFAELARMYSEDPATRDAGGDLGAFGRGTMLDAFEKATFALNPGDLCDHPVRTEVGYHVIKCTDHAPAFVHPLALVYSNVSGDAAREKADFIAHQRVDSLLAACPTLASLRAGAEKLGCFIGPFHFKIGNEASNPLLTGFFEQLERLKPGVGHTLPVFVKGDGYWVAWVDSITPPVAPSWEDAQIQVLPDYRRGAGRRAMEVKRVELDSLAAAGWSFDSLAALWGGPERSLDVTPARGLPGMGTSAQFDSLTFGTATGGPLPLNQPSGWLTMPNGLARIRVADRIPPPAEQLAVRAAGMRSAEFERRLRSYFADLAKRYPVQILDPRLRDVALAEPPPGMTP